ncbi:MAG: cysteine dioxygenase [Proteobacteria bacterium]|nr:cysteine dioxygenase [Pseudomonadota bacterium]MYJ94075.1 cysteine dioxygenase [Pseudomonadota bacterium]
MHPRLESFQSACADAVALDPEPCEIVRTLVPQMRELLQVAPDFLEPRHRQGSPDGYSRNLVFAGDDDALSLFTLVWAPGQRTPIHDHGTWGVVGVVEGMLEEQSFVRIDSDAAAHPDEGIELTPGGFVLLPPGAVVTFLPDPDHIHETGVPANRGPTLSLHLYGRFLNAFNVYDRVAGTRKLIQAADTELGAVPTSRCAA